MNNRLVFPCHVTLKSKLWSVKFKANLLDISSISCLAFKRHICSRGETKGPPFKGVDQNSSLAILMIMEFALLN